MEREQGHSRQGTSEMMQAVLPQREWEDKWRSGYTEGILHRESILSDKTVD